MRSKRKPRCVAQGQKYEDAVEHFERAANLFKGQSMWPEAANAFRKAAECHAELRSPFETGNKFMQAGECYKKASNFQDAVNVWMLAVEVFQENSRWNQCGNMFKNIGELYESGELTAGLEEDSLAEAIVSYEKAAENYCNESPPRQQAANGCLEKIALLSAKREDFRRAAVVFEDLAKGCLGNNLLKYNAKAHMTKALVCVLATGDSVAFRDKLNEYVALDFSFEGTREHMFLVGVSSAFEAGSAQQFGAACAEFNSIKKIDPWMTTVLLAAKGLIPEEEQESEPEEEDSDEDGADQNEEEEDLS